MALQEAITYLSNLVGSITGIRQASDYPPEALNEFPCIVCFSVSGKIDDGTPGVMMGLHNIAVDLYVARMDMPRDAEKIMKFIDDIPLIIKRNPTLGGNVSTIQTISYQISSIVYGSQDVLLCRWLLEEVKIRTVL